ncbi:MAG TPA: thioredoxin family protein [Phycisphaerae bacterium]|nr:thioredoxin family protein [Phycisphaerae bacterium]
MNPARHALFLTVVLSAVASVPIHAEEPFKDLDFKAAKKQAAADNKLIVIDFYTTWCGPCKMLDKTTWKDPDVIKWFNEKAIGLKMDAEKLRDLAKQYRISAYPTIILLKPDGAELDRLVGYRDAKTFLSDVTAAQSGSDSLSRARRAAERTPTDWKARSTFGDALRQKGQYKEALREYLWCWDEGEKHNPSYGGVRVSFLLGSIADLGREYPPALEALRKRRDACEKKVISDYSGKKNGGGKSAKTAKKKKPGFITGLIRGLTADSTPSVAEIASDCCSINGHIGEDDRSIQFYDKLRALGEEAKPARKRMLHHIVDRLVDARRYKDIVDDGGDPVRGIDSEFESYERDRKYFATQHQELAKEMEEHDRKSLIDDVGRHYEVLLGVGEFEKADAAAKQLLKFEMSPRTYSELIRRAYRAEAGEIAAELAREAGKELPEEERDKVETDPPGAPSKD